MTFKEALKLGKGCLIINKNTNKLLRVYDIKEISIGNKKIVQVECYNKAGETVFLTHKEIMEYSHDDQYTTILNCCPICGSSLDYQQFYNYTKLFSIGKTGKMSGRSRKRSEEGCMDTGFLSCSNLECGFTTDCDFIPIDKKHRDMFLEIYQDFENNGVFKIIRRYEYE